MNNPESKFKPYTKEEQEEAYKNLAQVRIFTLAQIMKIINTAQTRGAFQGVEMTFIGSIYDSLSKAVNKALERARNDLEDETDETDKTPLHQHQYQQQIETIKEEDVFEEDDNVLQQESEEESDEEEPEPIKEKKKSKNVFEEISNTRSDRKEKKEKKEKKSKSRHEIKRIVVKNSDSEVEDQDGPVEQELESDDE